MNKKIIALAVAAAFAAPMAANAAPSIGGHLQAEIVDWDKNGSANDVTAVEDNKRGRLWVTGSEDLGGGMKANYRYEWQVDTADGATTATDAGDNLETNAREARVGLSGGFGEVQLGRLKTPYKYTAGVDYDPFTATVLESRGNGGALKNDGGMTAAYGQNSFLSNSLAYKTKFGNAKFWALYQFSESNTNDDNIVLSLSVPVAKGMAVDLAYVTEEKVSTSAGGTRAKVGFKMKTGAHKVFVKYETQSSDAANSDFTAAFLGYHLSMGKNVLSIQYGTKDGDAANSDVDYAMLAVTRKLSKKTKAWAGYRSTDADNDTNDVDVFSVGMQIKF